jgi:hypothetical protein
MINLIPTLENTRVLRGTQEHMANVSNGLHLV